MRPDKTVPLAAAAEATEGAARHEPEETRSVLVVDDDDLVRSGAARSLARLGYRAPSVPGPAEALALLRAGKHRIDMLFTDIRMPGAIDGFELARIVRQEFPRIAILLTTGFAGVRPRGADTRILYKPYKLAELAAAVRETLAAKPHAT
jgi:CheY-like chemotaxis protein